MKKKYLLNANIVDPANCLNEKGGLIIDEKGNIEAIGKKVNNSTIIVSIFYYIRKKNSNI